MGSKAVWWGVDASEDGIAGIGHGITGRLGFGTACPCGPLFQVPTDPGVTVVTTATVVTVRRNSLRHIRTGHSNPTGRHGPQAVPTDGAFSDLRPRDHHDRTDLVDGDPARVGNHPRPPAIEQQAKPNRPQRANTGSTANTVDHPLSMTVATHTAAPRSMLPPKKIVATIRAGHPNRHSHDSPRSTYTDTPGQVEASVHCIRKWHRTPCANAYEAGRLCGLGVSRVSAAWRGGFSDGSSASSLILVDPLLQGSMRCGYGCRARAAPGRPGRACSTPRNADTGMWELDATCPSTCCRSISW